MFQPAANLSGTWYNELGSEMIITQSEDGTLNGTYCNHAPHSPPVKERLIGSVGTGVPATFGFIVNYEVSQRRIFDSFIFICLRTDALTTELLETRWRARVNLVGWTYELHHAAT